IGYSSALSASRRESIASSRSVMTATLMIWTCIRRQRLLLILTKGKECVIIRIRSFGALPDRGGRMKHTLESIAVLAGVSRGTVSRVINNQPGVKPHVREKVLDIIAKTGYVPHPQARSLA